MLYAEGTDEVEKVTCFGLDPWGAPMLYAEGTGEVEKVTFCWPGPLGSSNAVRRGDCRSRKSYFLLAWIPGEL